MKPYKPIATLVAILTLIILLKLVGLIGSIVNHARMGFTYLGTLLILLKVRLILVPASQIVKHLALDMLMILTLEDAKTVENIAKPSTY